mmetsp:Transcript_20836/g.45578  ORF Transcript_20836/g.45578 Transcript_20836/m.45578 type:complete len:278 (-) Transcript_20836:1321-2154(-)
MHTHHHIIKHTPGLHWAYKVVFLCQSNAELQGCSGALAGQVGLLCAQLISCQLDAGVRHQAARLLAAPLPVHDTHDVRTAGHIWRQAHMVHHSPTGGQVPHIAEQQGGMPAGQAYDALCSALAEGGLSNQQRAMGVMQCSGHQLTGTRRLAVHQHSHGQVCCRACCLIHQPDLFLLPRAVIHVAEHIPLSHEEVCHTHTRANKAPGVVPEVKNYGGDAAPLLQLTHGMPHLLICCAAPQCYSNVAQVLLLQQSIRGCQCHSLDGCCLCRGCCWLHCR